MRKKITRRTFLKGVGASAAGVATVRLFGGGVFASGEAASGEVSGAAVSSDKFVYAPYWGEDNVKTAVGGEILFFGDVHDLEDNYFYYDPATGGTRGVFTYLVEEDKHPGLYASIGDYLQASSDITSGADPYYKCIDRIRAWAGDDAVIVSVMGNHENKTSGDGELNGEQVFEKIVGNNNYGLIAKGVDAADPEKTLYYVVGLGCAHEKEIDEANARAAAGNKYWVNPDVIAMLDGTLAGIYGEDNSKNQGIPTFIDAHIPVHYYTAERSAENNCELLRVLNKYPNVVYVWGHNHSEKDSLYGTVKLPGNTIVPNAGLSDTNAAGDPAAQEIRFTYVSCGAVRGNQISDNSLENSERALYVVTEGSTLRFEYCGINGKPFHRANHTGIREATYFEDFRTLGARPAAGLSVDIAEEAKADVVRRGDFFLARPVAGQTPGDVVSFSGRYRTALKWLDAQGNEVGGDFGFGEAYTARLTLSSDAASFDLTGDDVYLFDTNAVAIPACCIAQKTVSVADGGAVIDIAFAETPALADEPLPAAAELEEGKRYVLASDTEQYLFTRSRRDCKAENGMLLTVPDTDMYWTFERQGDGYTMRSANGKYLTAGMNGPNLVLAPFDDPASGAYSVWTYLDGALSIDMAGTVYGFTYRNGAFLLASGAADTGCTLYGLG